MTKKEFKIQLALGLVPENSFLKRCWRCKTKTPHLTIKRYFDAKRLKGLKETLNRCTKCDADTYDNKIIK